MVTRVWAIAALLALGACGIDGTPVPPPPRDQSPPAADEAVPEERARRPGGPEVTVGVSGSIGGVFRR